MPESFFPAPRKKTWQRRTARFSNRCALFIFLSHDYINYGMHNTTLTNKNLIFKLLKNSPNWSPYISRDNKLREFDQGSKHFSFGVHLINSCNLLSWSCVDIIWRKSMLVTLRLMIKILFLNSDGSPWPLGPEEKQPRILGKALGMRG